VALYEAAQVALDHVPLQMQLPLHIYACMRVRMHVKGHVTSLFHALPDVCHSWGT